jgi:hypothetical protein
VGGSEVEWRRDVEIRNFIITFTNLRSYFDLDVMVPRVGTG